MPQGKMKTKVKLPTGTQVKSGHISKKKQMTKKGVRTIAPKKTKAIEAKKFDKAVSKAISNRVREDIKSQAENCDLKTLKQMKTDKQKP